MTRSTDPAASPRTDNDVPTSVLPPLTDEAAATLLALLEAASDCLAEVKRVDSAA